MPESPQQKPMDRDQAHSHEVSPCASQKNLHYRDCRDGDDVLVYEPTGAVMKLWGRRWWSEQTVSPCSPRKKSPDLNHSEMG